MGGLRYGFDLRCVEVSRQVAVVREQELPSEALLYRTGHSEWAPQKGIYHYDLPVEIYGSDHPLRLLYEHLLVGLQPPSVMVLQSISQVDAAVAAFLYLFPERINFFELGAFVDLVCRIERWGSLGSLPSANPTHVHVLNALRVLLPSTSDEDELSDRALTDILFSAVEVVGQSFEFEVTLDDLPGLDSVLFDSDRVAVVQLRPDAPADCWDGLFLTGKVVVMTIRPGGQIAMFRRSLLVNDIDFRAVCSVLADLEDGWRLKTPLALLGPRRGTSIPPSDLADFVRSAVIC